MQADKLENKKKHTGKLEKMMSIANELVQSSTKVEENAMSVLSMMDKQERERYGR